VNPLIHKLLAEAPVVTDGAWGTQLQELGLRIGDCPDAWNLSHADRVEAVARSYIAAGSRVILTNTFGANRIALARHGLEDQADAINQAGAAISCRAAGGSARVFASMGPTGALLASSEVSEEEIRIAFQEQARAFVAGGAEAVVIETMSDPAEARLAVEAVRETGLPVVACMTFGAGRDGDLTPLGVTPEQAAQALEAAGADVIGANCGTGARSLLAVCRRLSAATDRPIWVKPSAGLPEVVEGSPPSLLYHITPEEFAADAALLVKVGAAFVGGCCGTGPAFIRALRNRLREEPSA
jgi:5-methyltetrahydrofolate--homocysteine methyltransferase